MNNSLNLLEMIGNAGLVVQFVLLTLMFFSIASWTIIFIKFRMIRKAYAQSIAFTEAFWKSRDLSDAYSYAKKLSDSPVAKMFRAGYLEIKKFGQQGVSQDPSQPKTMTVISDSGGLDTIKRALRRTSTAEVTRMGQMVPFLATTGNTTPFIGLFGTVWGIMNSFHGIGQRGSATLAVVAPGISEALVATAAGLAVAIPAVIAFNFFTQKIRVIAAEMENFSSDFLNIVERDILSS